MSHRHLNFFSGCFLIFASRVTDIAKFLFFWCHQASQAWYPVPVLPSSCCVLQGPWHEECWVCSSPAATRWEREQRSKIGEWFEQLLLCQGGTQADGQNWKVWEMNKGNAEEIQVQWKYFCKRAAGTGFSHLCPVAKVHPVGLATCYPLEYCISGCIAFTGMESKASVSYLHLHFCVWVVCLGFLKFF